ncbi:MAG: sugar ABC transporter permease [Actinomycetota bacterium]|nr:sugar ABC transporter permease [Actinomycetota bacterium]
MSSAALGEAAARRRPAVRSRVWFEGRALPWLLLAPAGTIIFGLILYPVGRTFWLSFQEAGLAFLARGESTFVGLDNYADLNTDVPPIHLRRVFLTTAVFGLACVAATMTVGLAVALLLNQRFRGRAVLGVLVLLPWAVPRVAAGVVWRWMFHDQYGLVNWALPGMDGFSWFNERLTAFFAIGVVVVWQSFPFVALSLLAGLSSIPPEVREAARVDGASPFQTLRHVTLPMLKPLLLVLVVVSTIWDFKIFDQVYVMTEGGPARSTEVAAITVYREAFGRLHLGTAAAMAMALFAVLAVMTLLYTRLARVEETRT